MSHDSVMTYYDMVLCVMCYGTGCQVKCFQNVKCKCDINPCCYPIHNIASTVDVMDSNIFHTVCVCQKRGHTWLHSLAFYLVSRGMRVSYFASE